MGGPYLIRKVLYFREKVEIGGVGARAPERGSQADDARGGGSTAAAAPKARSLCPQVTEGGRACKRCLWARAPSSPLRCRTREGGPRPRILRPLR